MGRSQRQKGAREERLLVEDLRKAGWDAKRVPLSGAAQGFKGDVIAEKEGRTYVLEKKSRKDEFKTVYEAYAALKKEYAISLCTFTLVADIGGAVCVDLTDNLDDLLPGLGFIPAYLPLTQVKAAEQHGRALKRLLGFRKWVKDADVLVLRDNGRPHLYVRYR